MRIAGVLIGAGFVASCQRPPDSNITHSRPRASPVSKPPVALDTPQPSASPNACPEEEISLTGKDAVEWRQAYLGFVGRAALVVCRADAPLVRQHHSALVHELDGVVKEIHFGMVGVCHVNGGPASDGDPFKARYQHAVERFDRVIGRPVVRQLRCRFGWRHYDLDGQVVSGVG